MDAQLSLLMANQALVRSKRRSSVTLWICSQASPGKLMYDPFVGTGSMAYVGTPPDPCGSALTTLDYRILGFFLLRIRHRWTSNERKRYEPFYQEEVDFLSRCCVEKNPGILRSAAQYGVASRIIDLCSFDITHNPWRCGELFDAIVTDPPCIYNLRHFLWSSQLKLFI